jgi:hypothetical protein
MLERKWWLWLGKEAFPVSCSYEFFFVVLVCHIYPYMCQTFTLHPVYCSRLLFPSGNAEESVEPEESCMNFDKM